MADKALIPVSSSLKTKVANQPNSEIPVQMTIGPSITGAEEATLIEDVKSMTGGFSKAGNIANFRVQGNRVQDLPMPEGVQYDTPYVDHEIDALLPRACTHQVMKMVNPETGETTTATDGCQISDLKDAGWVPATAEPVRGGNGSNGGSNGGSGGGGGQQAGFSGTDMAIAAAGALIIGGIAWSSSS